MTANARKITEELTAALEHGVDVAGRRIFLHGGVDEETIGVAIRGMYLLSNRSKAPIELFITSYGGELDEAFALHDVTRTLTVPVHTIAVGKCQSAAPLIVACGERGHRYASDNCEFMVHDACIGVDEASPAWIEAQVLSAKRRMATMASLMAEYTKKDKRHWTRLFASKIDKFFDADTALAWGLIDSVWAEK